MTDPDAKTVLARYSALKVGAWVALVLAVCVSILRDGASRGWSLPEGRYAWLFPGTVVGSGVGLVVALALLANLALARGVAIAEIDGVLVLYFPFSRKRVGLRRKVSATATAREIDAPQSGGWIRSPPIFAKQVTFRCPGQADVNFRTGLLSESAEVIAERFSALTD